MKRGFEHNLGNLPIDIPEISREKLPGTDLGRSKKEKPYKGTLTPKGLVPRNPEIEQDLKDGKREIAREAESKRLSEFEKENGFAVDNLILNANGLNADAEAEEAISETLDPRTRIQRKINTKTTKYERLQTLAQDLTDKIKRDKTNPNADSEQDEDTLFAVQNEMLKVSGEIEVLKTEQRNNLFNPIRTQTKKAKNSL